MGTRRLNSTMLPLIHLVTTVNGVKYIGSPYTDTILPLTATTAEKYEYRMMADELRTRAMAALDCTV